MLTAIRRLVSQLMTDLATLIRDLAPSSHERVREQQAQQDDLLDATLDEDEMDASGL